MNSVKGLVLALCVSVLLCGCNEPGMNVKMGSADASAGVAAVGTLEAVPVEKFEVTKAKIIEISTELLGFVKTGQLAQLPLDEVKVALENLMIQKGWGQYTYLVDVAIQWVKTQSVNVGAIGADNVKLIEISLEEINRNAERCTVAGRTKWKQDARRLRKLEAQQ